MQLAHASGRTRFDPWQYLAGKENHDAGMGQVFFLLTRQGVAGYIQPERYVMLTDTQIGGNLKPAEKAKKIRGRRRTVPLCCQNRLKTLAYGVPFQQQGKSCSVSGNIRLSPLKDARTKRNEGEKLLADGIDPEQAQKGDEKRRPPRRPIPSSMLSVNGMKRRQSSNSPKDRKRKLSTFEFHLFPALKRKPISEVTAQDLLLDTRRLKEREKELIAHQNHPVLRHGFPRTPPHRQSDAQHCRRSSRSHTSASGQHRATIVSR